MNLYFFAISLNEKYRIKNSLKNKILTRKKRTWKDEEYGNWAARDTPNTQPTTPVNRNGLIPFFQAAMSKTYINPFVEIIKK